MEDGYLGVILACLTIGFGWFLSSLAQWFGRRKGNHQIRNQALFNLLELHFLFHQLKQDDKIDLLLNEVFNFMPELNKDEMPTQVKTLITNLIMEDNAKNVRSDLELAQKAYAESIENLAKIDPIRAYRLRGKSNIFLVFDSFDSFIEELENELSDDNDNSVDININEIQDAILSEIEPKIIEEGISDLQDEIRSLAWSINPIVWKRSCSVLKNVTPIKSVAELENMKKVLAEILPIITAKFPQ